MPVRTQLWRLVGAPGNEVQGCHGRMSRAVGGSRAHVGPARAETHESRLEEFYLDPGGQVRLGHPCFPGNFPGGLYTGSLCPRGPFAHGWTPILWGCRCCSAFSFGVPCVLASKSMHTRGSWAVWVTAVLEYVQRSLCPSRVLTARATPEHPGVRAAAWAQPWDHQGHPMVSQEGGAQ